MLYYIFTIDGDWAEYFDTRLSEKERKPNLSRVLALLEKEVWLTRLILGGRFLHFIHTSPLAEDFFLRTGFIDVWKKIEGHGGSIGIHCHDDDTNRISKFTNQIRSNGLNPIAYRGGFLAFSPLIIPILEENKLLLDFSCEPGRYQANADWRGAPENFYQMDYSDHRKKGQSKVFEIPLGKSRERLLYFEKFNLMDLQDVAQDLKLKSKNKDVIVSVLAHTYDFASNKQTTKIALALMLLKRYGRFINAEEAYNIING